MVAKFTMTALGIKVKNNNKKACRYEQGNRNQKRGGGT